MHNRMLAAQQTDNVKAQSRLVAYYDSVDSYVRNNFPDPIQAFVPRSRQDVDFASCHAVWNEVRELRDCLIQNFHWDGTEAVTWARDSTVRAVSVQTLVTSLQSIVPRVEASFAQPNGNVTVPALLAAIIRILSEQDRISYAQSVDALQRFISTFGDLATAGSIEELSGVKLGTAASGGRELKPLPEIMNDLSIVYTRLLAGGQRAQANELLRTLFGVRGQSLAVGAVILKEMPQSIEDAARGVRLY